jgi:hypothetical protein
MACTRSYSLYNDVRYSLLNDICFVAGLTFFFFTDAYFLRFFFRVYFLLLMSFLLFGCAGFVIYVFHSPPSLSLSPYIILSYSFVSVISYSDLSIRDFSFFFFSSGLVGGHHVLLVFIFDLFQLSH